MIRSPAFAEVPKLDLGVKPFHKVTYGIDCPAQATANPQISYVARSLYNGGAEWADTPTTTSLQMTYASRLLPHGASEGLLPEPG